MTTPRDKFISILKNCLQENSFVKLNLGNYKGEEAELKKLLIKKVVIKKKENLSFVYRYQSRDITKNYPLDESVELLQTLVDQTGFRHANLFTLD